MGRGGCAPSLWTTRALEKGALASLTVIGRLWGAPHTPRSRALRVLGLCAHARVYVAVCTLACAGMWSGEGCQGKAGSGPPAPRLPSPGPAPPWMAGVEQGFRNSQGRDQTAGKGQERLSVPGGSALVTQSESISGPQPHCGPGGGGSGVRGRGWLSRKARFHLLLRGCRLRTAGKSPGRTGPQVCLERKSQVWVAITQPEGCSPAPLLPSDLGPSLVTEAGLASGRGYRTGPIPFAALPTPRCQS